MRTRIILPIIVAATLGSPAAAYASFAHVVTAGETLSSVAAADGLSITQLAAANGLSPSSQLVSGTTLMIPPQGAGAQSAAPVSTAVGDGDNDSDDVGSAAGVTSSSTAGGSYVVQPGDTLTAIAARAGVSVSELAAANGLNLNAPLLAGTALNLSGASPTTGSAVASSPVATTAATGGYIVQPGDTLSAIAARAGLTVNQLAAEDGLNPGAVLLAGSTIALPGASASAASAAGQPMGAVAEGSSGSPPYPTPQFVSPSEVGSIASANGVPASLAEAIGYQESGFNNDEVSTADARGVMQILPGTWDWIQRTLTPNAPLAPASAADNVRGGVLLLRSLLDSTGSSELAAASYYQGLGSVEKNGLLPETQQYVRDVMSLEQQFGGG